MTPFSWQRAVIKVGSALISPNGDGCSAEYLLSIAKFITVSRQQGKDIIVVSSGSIAAGRSSIKTGLQASIAEKQAMAAIGQTQMMANWARFFDFPCAQILLTLDDLHDRRRYVNVKNTLRELLANNALPIVNENDTVAVDEIKVGDNDNLAAHTALVAQADTLIICTDVDGLFDADPRQKPNAKLLSNVKTITSQIRALAGGAGTADGTGGMITKLQAAQKCAESGVQTLLVNGKQSSVFDLLAQGLCPGTLFDAAPTKRSARHQWLSHTVKSKGTLTLDLGAYMAVTEKGASLLAVGISAISGNFKSNDAVDITYQGCIVAKGISLYSHTELQSIKGLNSNRIEDVLGFSHGEEAVHRDDLVLIKALIP
ncbi:glutamate 5-kinase [Brumicola pallidula]|jgi:glutamate 5-kinase|uniref:Glutamate 5-kinase n=1 Tax=Brumicola pallidula DSM 14239 = ACAM 615 TaxID=1121922 RepID=K6YU73_9ALTE|nr:glutamate 5-kinase [Glaciecola pallidula]GAC27521.1 glutamate 5-kinase [Glaciecola pallidula DSM 14239 = ACAM 615]